MYGRALGRPLRWSAGHFGEPVGGDHRFGVLGDLVGRVLGNLPDNAQRHACTAITVTVNTEPGAVILIVTDDGHGVAPPERERVFERFVRLDEARSRDEGGAGLGLAIARDVAQQHGGTLSPTDTPGGGTVFEVKLSRAH